MPPDRPPRAAAYRVYGMSQSYFTRKFTGYLDYKAIPDLMRRFAGANRLALKAGWPGAMPIVMTPGDEFMWDTTAMIHHLESRFPEPGVFPADPLLRFIDYVLEDALDGVLERAGILQYFADYADRTSTLPNYEQPPRPARNRPFAPPWEREQWPGDTRGAGKGD